MSLEDGFQTKPRVHSSNNLGAPVGVAPSRRTSSPRFCTMVRLVVVMDDDAKIGRAILVVVEVKDCTTDGKHDATPMVAQALRKIFIVM